MSEETQMPSNPEPNQQGQSQGQNPYPPNFQQPPFGYHYQPALPNATAVLILGILSIVSCCCYGVPGIIFAIIALFLARKDKQLYTVNPMWYSQGSFKNLNAGRICAIIGLSLSILYLLFYIMFVILFGFKAINNPNDVQDLLNSFDI